MERNMHLVRGKEDISNRSEISNPSLKSYLLAKKKKKKKKEEKRRKKRGKREREKEKKEKMSQIKEALKKHDNKMQGVILNCILYREIKNSLHLHYWDNWGNLCKNSFRNDNVVYWV